jgi:hypothetical protein
MYSLRLTASKVVLEIQYFCKELAANFFITALVVDFNIEDGRADTYMLNNVSCFLNVRTHLLVSAHLSHNQPYVGICFHAFTMIITFIKAKS